MPTTGHPSPFRGTVARHNWESAPRLLFLLKAMHQLTGDEIWHQRYLAKGIERGGNANRTRLSFCQTGLIFDPGQRERNSWTGSISVVCLRALWEMETDPALKDVYAQGLMASAKLCLGSLPLCQKFDLDNKEHFEHDWRLMNEAWRPQQSEEDAVAVANAGLLIQHRTSQRMHSEKEWVRERCFAAWVVTLCPDKTFIEQHRDAILKLILHYRYERLYLSQFFPVESAWYRLKL